MQNSSSWKIIGMNIFEEPPPGKSPFLRILRNITRDVPYPGKLTCFCEYCAIYFRGFFFLENPKIIIK